LLWRIVPPDLTQKQHNQKNKAMIQTSVKANLSSQLRGSDLLHNPHLNKSTAFTAAERESLGLVGLLPEGLESEETQIQRVMRQLGHKTTDLDKYIYLSALQDNDETLYFKTLMSDPAQFIPLVYTPTVGEACQKFGHILRRPKGLYLSITRRGQIKEILQHWTERDVRFIVVTDGERILGLGDLGVNGMGIPIGKLSLYTACAGVPPQYTLPITLDVGTNNESLLNDPLYLGLRQPRVRGEEYDAFIEEFVTAVQEVFPGCCIQFEDFANINAIPTLARYRDRVCCFNDDIQGTAAVAVAGILAALRITGGKAEQARARCWLFDRKGLVESSRTDLADFKKPFAHPHAAIDDFVTAIADLKPTAIIGVSALAKAFNQQVIETMARVNQRPIIFPYSNPTSHSECTAEEAYKWSEGRAVFASGSPFPPVKYGDKTFVPGQGNNVYIFPAMGMAVYATGAKRVTDEMFITAAKALAEQVSSSDLAVGLVYPPQSEIYNASIHIAEKVVEVIFERNLASVEKPSDLKAFIAAQAYKPDYKSLV
jgi:malate dehydrogenase (oxaloacetate-decarboxylating)(NADP+)